MWYASAPTYLTCLRVLEHGDRSAVRVARVLVVGDHELRLEARSTHPAPELQRDVVHPLRREVPGDLRLVQHRVQRRLDSLGAPVAEDPHRVADVSVDIVSGHPVFGVHGSGEERPQAVTPRLLDVRHLRLTELPGKVERAARSALDPAVQGLPRPCQSQSTIERRQDLGLGVRRDDRLRRLREMGVAPDPDRRAEALHHLALGSEIDSHDSGTASRPSSRRARSGGERSDPGERQHDDERDAHREVSLARHGIRLTRSGPSRRFPLPNLDPIRVADAHVA